MISVESTTTARLGQPAKRYLSLACSIFLLLGVFVSYAGPISASPARTQQALIVQQASATIDNIPGPNSLTVALANSVVSGDLLVVGVIGGAGLNNPFVQSNIISDSLGSSFITAVYAQSHFQQIPATIYASTLSSSGQDSVTVSFGGNIGEPIQIFAFELAGATTLSFQTGAGTGTTCSHCQASFSTSPVSFESGAFLLSVVGEGNSINGATSFAAGPGFTVANNAGSFDGYAEYSVGGVSAPSDFPATMNNGFNANLEWVEASIAIQPTVRETTTIVSTATVASTTVSTTVTTEGSLETAIANTQGTFHSGDTIASLLYALTSSVSGVQSSLAAIQSDLSLSGSIGTSLSGISSALASLQSSVSILQNGLIGPDSALSQDFAGVTSNLDAISSGVGTLQASVTSLTSTMTSGFGNVSTALSGIQSSLGGISAQLSSIQSSLSSLGHPGLASSGSGETTLTSSSPSATIFISPNGKVSMVALSVNATSGSHEHAPPTGLVVINLYTDPSNPTIFIQQTASSGPGPGSANVFLGTGAAWKVTISTSFPLHEDASVTVDWAFSSSGPP